MSPGTRSLLAAGLALLLLSAILGVLANEWATFPGDVAVNRWAREIGPAFRPIAWVFNELDIVLAVVLTVAAGVLLARRGDAESLAVVLVVTAARPLVGVLKDIIDRPRPRGDFPIYDIVGDPSFPSGHVVSAATYFGVWLVFAPDLVGPRWVPVVRALSVVGIAVMAISRMWSGVHWFSDTYGAVVWTAALFALALAARQPLGAAVRSAARPLARGR